MAKIRNENRAFEPIPKALINDDTLSDRARFLYCYMSAKPDYWDFYLDEIAKSLHLGRDTIQKYIKELISAGWIKKGEQQNENGKFGAVEYVLKAFKTTPTVEEKNRYGKIPLQNNSSINTPINNISTINSPDNTEIESISKTRFQKPKIDEIEAYIKEKKMHFDATDFYDYYESVGWMVGKKHMKDWKAACRTWESKRKDMPVKESEEQNEPDAKWIETINWLDRNVPLISNGISPNDFAIMKSMTESSQQLAKILVEINNTCPDGDILSNFKRILHEQA